MSSDAIAPLRVGLVGAGPWAHFVHAPTLAAGPETTLTGIWSRTYEKAVELAGVHGVPAFATIDELLESCDAVACCVAPAAQVDIAVRAAELGKALFLEKPLGPDLAGATRVADAVRTNGVGSIVLLTYRFAPSVRAFLEQTAQFEALGARACFLSGAFLAGPFSESTWRQQEGPLLDVGPHVLDLVDAALGPIERVMTSGDAQGWVGVLAHHASGATSDVALCCTTAIDSRTDLEVFGREGSLRLDGRADARTDVFAIARREFAQVARTGEAHVADAQRALHVQRIVDAATRSLASGRSESV